MQTKLVKSENLCWEEQRKLSGLLVKTEGEGKTELKVEITNMRGSMTYY